MKIPNLGEFRVLTLRELPPDPSTYDTPERIAAYFRATIAPDPRHNPDVESFYVLSLDTRRHIIGFHLVAHGTLDTILVHAREVFRPAIVANASAIVAIHNHPSGDPTPSEADIKVTRDLMRAGQLLKIDLLDHVIMGSPSAAANAPTGNARGWVSLRELGYFYAPA